MLLSMQHFLFFFLVSSLSWGEAVSNVKPRKIDPKPHVAALEKSWEALERYRSKFKQSIHQKFTNTTEPPTAGTLAVAKPNRLRWDSETDGVIQILNGPKLSIVTRNMRRGSAVIETYPDSSLVADTRLLKFLSGKAKFSDLYLISVVSETPDRVKLWLSPKNGKPEDSLVAEVDKKSYLLRSLTNESMETRVTTEFSEIEVNPTLDESLFTYKPGPKDIVHDNP